GANEMRPPDLFRIQRCCKSSPRSRPASSKRSAHDRFEVNSICAHDADFESVKAEDRRQSARSDNVLGAASDLASDLLRSARDPKSKICGQVFESGRSGSEENLWHTITRSDAQKEGDRREGVVVRSDRQFTAANEPT